MRVQRLLADGVLVCVSLDRLRSKSRITKLQTEGNFCPYARIRHEDMES